MRAASIAVAATAAASANPGQSVDQRWRRAWSADGSATACMVACGQWRCAEARPGRQMNPMHIIQESMRSEEHTSELQSLMRISYAVFCLKKKKYNINDDRYSNIITRKPK